MNAIPASSSLTAEPSQKTNGTGRKLFMQYCATCHGTDAKGTGPTAKLLKKAPADLTRIEKENGKFPFSRVQRVIAGDDMLESHGSRDMPVWGTILRRKSGPGFATLEIYNLTKYLESIQQ
ncbi:MAG TPA: cytochrome c [Blastocatellia bacterium]|nr:cytochrome c [Blastocatellia bacterium]